MAEVGATVHSITGRQTTAAAAEEPLLLILDGAAPAGSIAVPAGTTVIITDVMPGGDSTTMYRIQQTNDGVTWFDVALFEITGTVSGGVSTPIYNYNTGIVINGGPTVAFRVQVETPAGANLVMLTIRSYTSP